MLPITELHVKPAGQWPPWTSTCRLIAGTLLLGFCGLFGLAFHAIPYLTYFYKDLIVDTAQREVFTYDTNWRQFGFTVQVDVTTWFFLPLAMCIFVGPGVWRTALVVLVTAATTG